MLFTRAADLVQSLIEARDERRLTALQQRYQKVALLVVDELGFVPFERAGGELLFNLLAQRYERRSIIITSNLAFSEWVKVFGDERVMRRICAKRFADGIRQPADASVCP